MKKKKSTGRVIVAITVLCVIAIFFRGIRSRGEKPFKDLTTGEVTAASVRLTPPDTEVSLTEEEIVQLVNILNNVVIYQQDGSYFEYNGQWVEFTLTKQDGARLSIVAYNPFLVLDGTGYRTKYEPCEELNRFANSLVSENR